MHGIMYATVLYYSASVLHRLMFVRCWELLNLLFSALAHRRMVGEITQSCAVPNIDKTTAAPFHCIRDGRFASNIWIFKSFEVRELSQSVKSLQFTSTKKPRKCLLCALQWQELLLWIQGLCVGCWFGDWLLSLDHGGNEISESLIWEVKCWTEAYRWF